METQNAEKESLAAPASWLNVAVRVSLGLLLATCLALAVREAIANLLAAKKSPDAFARAARWDGSNPDFPARSAQKFADQGRDADPREIARAFEEATNLGPHRAENWAGLGEALDLMGDSAGATRAYKRALELFPRSPDINWEFANFMLRSGEIADAIAPLRVAMDGDPSLRVGAFDLAWRAGIPQDQILAALPAREDILSAYLDYLDASGRVDAAGDAWKRLLSSPETINLDAACRYFDALLYAHRVDALVPVWTSLTARDPDRFGPQADSKNRITNGGFEDPMVNGGFSWRLTPIEGANTSLDTDIVHDGSRSLLVHFDGTHNLEFSHVMQYVPVEPDRHYRFVAYARSEGITTDSGPRIAVYDAYDRAELSMETESLVGTTSWQEQKLDFRTGPRTRLLVVQVARRASRKLDNQIAGSLWLDDFSLSAAP
jgi:tetratricopeptide (TPR) repeat protein